MGGILLRFAPRAKAEYRDACRRGFLCGGARPRGARAPGRRPSAPSEPGAEVAIAGLYPGVQDLTARYGTLSLGPRPQTRGVVLHRTETRTAASVLAAYRDRIQKGSDIGAQYLIDEDGATLLITPADALVSHTHGFNEVTLGIEVVGPAIRLDPYGGSRPLRRQLAAIPLSPQLKARLLGYDDRTLARVVAANGREIYPDLTAAQKDAVLTLCYLLARDYELDLGSLSQPGPQESGRNNYTLDDLPAFSAHEHLDDKALGEGEAMIELLAAAAK